MNMDGTGGIGGITGTGLSKAEIDSMPVDVLAFYLAVAQTANLDQQIKQKLGEIQGRQQAIKSARTQMESIAAKMAKCGEKGASPQVMDGALLNYLNANGIKDPSTNLPYQLSTKENPKAYTKEEWQVIKTQVENVIKDHNSSVELDMLSVQSLMSKRNQALEMASNIMKKSGDVKSSIIRNMA
jgi:hypothetical protein